MKILSIDSAGRGCGVCLWDDGVRLVRYEAMMRGQDARLIPLVQEVMAEASWRYNDLDRIAVLRGPGSFTGLRIGLAAARGIGFAAERPVIGVDRFVVYRTLYADAARPFFVVLESQRLELYVQGPLTDDVPKMLTPDEIAALLQEDRAMMLATDAQTTLGAFVDMSRIFPPMARLESDVCAQLAARAPENHPAYAASPLYLRAPDVTMPKVCESL